MKIGKFCEIIQPTQTSTTQKYTKSGISKDLTAYDEEEKGFEVIEEEAFFQKKKGPKGQQPYKPKGKQPYNRN